jgi:exopolysaccharide production protein ExoZ
LYKSLQAGRAFAAIFVLLFHLGGAIAAEKYFGLTAFSIPFSFGGAGVEFFFVLSGFIILTAHRHDIFKPEKLASYLKKRITRIYPTYWVIFLGTYLLALSSSTLRNTVPHDIFIIVKSMLLIPQETNVVGGTGSPVIIVAWTLQYEVFFYLFFSFMILSRWLSIIAGLVLLCIYVSYHGVPSPFFPLSFLSKNYILLFAMGMFVSAVCTSKRVTVNKPMFYAIIGAALFSFVALNTVLKTELLLGEQTTILYGVASSLIILGFVKAEDNGHVIGGNRWIQLLGNASYALYLIHYPLISILCKLSLTFHLDKVGIIGAFVSYLSIFCVCLVSSAAFHLWIEKPVTSHIRKILYQP